MKWFSEKIINHKKSVVAFFLATAVLCGILQFFVSVNYNVAEYLPEDAKSTRAIDIMDKEFKAAVPNARVMVKDVSIQEAIKYKEALEEIQGVSNVFWLDDVVDVKEPLEVLDPSTVEAYYKHRNALINITIQKGQEVTILNKIYDLIGDDNFVSGDAVNNAYAQQMSGSETAKAMVILIPAIIIILLISTSSWMEPILFLSAIGVSVLINMGSNIFLGEVSFVTQSVSPILQLAVSLDYAIFLLHSFQDYRQETTDVEEAMKLAMKKSFPTIMASAATTLFGFMALSFMKFKIGSDLGNNLVKGIIFSFTSVMVFLPALTLWSYKIIDKTKHKIIMPSSKNIGKYTSKIRIPVLILVALLIVPSFLAQGKNDFTYGTGGYVPGSRSERDALAINDIFGESNPIVILVPKGDVVKELALSKELEDIAHVNQVLSYSYTVGTAIPMDYLDEEILNQFYSENYSRIIAYTDTSDEGTEAFGVVEKVENTAREYYGDNFYSCGKSVNLYDIKNVVVKDNKLVNMLAIIAIGLVLLVTFKSISIPLILLIVIETSIWINLSVPYFTASALCYIGYLVINTVQLGATVDYAILFSDNYRRNRKEMTAKQAVIKTLGDTFASILVSGSILATSGFCLGYTSSNPIVSQLGILLGRGTVLSVVLVVCFLPSMLILFDKAIEKTTYSMNAFKEEVNL